MPHTLDRRELSQWHSEVKHVRLLFTGDGVPPACILKQLEPYTPWSHATERGIKELEKGAGQKLLQSRAPKHLWDDCLKLQAYIMSNNANDIYKLDREVCKTTMSGNTSDISQFCKFLSGLCFYCPIPRWHVDIILGHYWCWSSHDCKDFYTEQTSFPQINTQTIDPKQDSRQRWVRCPRTVHSQSHEKLEYQVLPSELEDIKLENTP